MIRGIAVLVCVIGCSARVAPSGWEAQSYREQYPDTPAGCVTVWTTSECRLLGPSGEPALCASGEDVTLLRRPGAFCEYAMNHGCTCDNRSLEESQ